MPFDNLLYKAIFIEFFFLLSGKSKMMSLSLWIQCPYTNGNKQYAEINCLLQKYLSICVVFV